MKILYFTTSMISEDFGQFTKLWKISLNPSNQNFHNKVIRSLAKTEEVEVFSLRPFSRKYCLSKHLNAENKVKDNIKWHYLAVSKHKLFRVNHAKKQLIKLLKNADLTDTVILSDTINPSVISLATFVSKKYRLPVVGICTDSPSNISGTSKSYAHFLLQKSRYLDGYIALTDRLGELFNPEGKPQMILEGIIEDNLPPKIENKYGKYIFFGGALLPKYGIYQLIDAFKQLGRDDIKLIICGHHADKKLLESKIQGSNIEYLKLLSVNEVLQLEQNAILNVNPRPYSEDLDRYSIPSKTLEYFSSGTLTLSVRNSKIQCNFLDCALWCKSHESKDLKECLEKALAMSEEERKTLGLKARERVLSLYSLEAVNKKILNFIRYFTL